MKPSKKTITLADLRKHHIGHHPYPTDPDYLLIARNLQKIILKNVDTKPLGDDFAQTLAINLTLHLEDTVADAGLWRTFCTEHRRLYGRWLPFGWGDDDDMPLDEVTLGSCQFIIWMTLCDTKTCRSAHPMMPLITALAAHTFAYLDTVFCDVPINDDLLDDIYPDEDDFIQDRTILEWLAIDSYLSDWYVTRDTLEEHRDTLTEAFEDISSDQATYGARAMSAFGSKVGPLALLPQEWYAAMLRTNPEKDCKQRADTIAAIQHAPFGAYIIENTDEKFINVQDFDGQHYAIQRFSFGPTLALQNLSHVNTFAGMMARYKGEWQANGMSTFLNSAADFEQEKKLYRQAQKLIRNNAKIINKYVDSRHGQRLYYFDNIPAITRWLKEDVQFEDVETLAEGFHDDLKQADTIVIYLAKDGSMPFTTNNADALKDPQNPFYDPQHGRDYGPYNLETNLFSGECIRYMLSRGIFADAAFNSPLSPQLNHTLFQQNIDFLARFTRRARY